MLGGGSSSSGRWMNDLLFFSKRGEMMEKAIMKDPFFLSQVSEEATKEDLYLAQDLQDTLRAHQ